MEAHHPSICPRYHAAVELLGRRWSGAILQTLLAGRTRYATLREIIPEISDRMLCERLRELEAEGIVVRHVAADVPVRVEYELTEKGRGLEKAIKAIAAWAEQWIPAPARAPRRPAKSRAPRRSARSSS